MIRLLFVSSVYDFYINIHQLQYIPCFIFSRFFSHFMLIISMTGETRASHEKKSRPDRCRWAMDVTLEAIHDNVEAWQYALPPAGITTAAELSFPTSLCDKEREHEWNCPQ